jgi:hypothetical protein
MSAPAEMMEMMRPTPCLWVSASGGPSSLVARANRLGIVRKNILRASPPPILPAWPGGGGMASSVDQSGTVHFLNQIDDDNEGCPLVLSCLNVGRIFATTQQSGTQ